MKVFILGGTGFLGYHAALELIAHGHQVSTLTLPPAPPENLFPEGVDVILGDFHDLTDDSIKKLMLDCEGVIFAAGADDRITPPVPAYDFFYRENVQAAARFFRLAKLSGVKRGVLISSYFAHFDRTWPELSLADYHPYIRSRYEQEKEALKVSGNEMVLTILQLPYVFGALSGREPMWKPLVDYVHWPIPWIFYTRGGSAVASVETVASAIVSALENAGESHRYLIGDENLTWQALLNRLYEISDLEKQVVTLPDGLVRMGMRGLSLWHKLKGLEAGLNPVKFIELQTRQAFFDIQKAQKVLGFERGDLNSALAKTVSACGYQIKSK